MDCDLNCVAESSFPKGDVGRAKFWLNVRLCCSQFLEMERGEHIWVHVKGGERALKISTKEQDDVNDVLKRRRRKYVLRKSAQTSSSSTRLQKQRSREKERPDCRNVFSLLSVVGVIVGPSLYLACNCGLVSDS